VKTARNGPAKKKRRGSKCRGVQRKNGEVELLDDADRFLDVLVGFVDVLQRAHLKALSKRVVFFLGYVVMSLVDKLKSPVETSAPVEAGINGRMIVQVLAIIDGRSLDFADSFIDIVDGFLFLFAQFPAVGPLEMSPGMAQIRQSMQISRMLPRRLRCCGDNRWNDEQKSNDYEHQFAKAFHRPSNSLSIEIRAA
jgi:hypothetical protein